MVGSPSFNLVGGTRTTARTAPVPPDCLLALLVATCNVTPERAGSRIVHFRGLEMIVAESAPFYEFKVSTLRPSLLDHRHVLSLSLDSAWPKLGALFA